MADQNFQHWFARAFPVNGGLQHRMNYVWKQTGIVADDLFEVSIPFVSPGLILQG
ncbi:hypothetical protein [Gluconobacter aidae]|uniref:hypothetical protein n=1 Tax=Gluconobacter aidae TaxID=2662454 RepID=UPI001297C798|nr:hypothetical protein [Gluconobacter aidae]